MTSIKVYKYQDGKEAVIEHNGKSISLAITENGVHDVQDENGKVLSTTTDPHTASNSVRDYLNNGG